MGESLDFGHILWVELTGFADRLDVCVKEEEGSRKTKVFGLNHWANTAKWKWPLSLVKDH